MIRLENLQLWQGHGILIVTPIALIISFYLRTVRRRLKRFNEEHPA